jgi:alpha-tubulin suppressor-like RCC1 family protein
MRLFLPLLLLPAACSATIEPDPPHSMSYVARAFSVADLRTLLITDLGTLVTFGPDIPSPVDESGNAAPLKLPAADDVAVGRRHACVVSTTGSVHCWGDHSGGALGSARTCTPPMAEGGQPDCILGPEILPKLPPVRAIAAGDDVTCAIVHDGDRVICWGDAHLTGGSVLSAFDPPTPVRVDGDVMLAAARIIISHGTVCAIDHDDVLWCWGDGFGTLPVRQPQVGVVDIAIGTSHTCIADRDGVSCWGSERNGESGDLAQAKACGASPGPCSHTEPVHVGIDGPVRVVVGERHSCALDHNGDVSCWGSNEVGQLGRTDAFLAGGVEFALDGVIDLAAGFAHTCAQRSDHTLWCWGDL